jgi:drug/metabolite transporter (DMT)-like permease
MTNTRASAAGHVDRRLSGIALMISAFAAFTLLDATAKYLVASFDTVQVVFARYFGALFFAVVFFARSDGLSMMRSRRPILQTVRAAMLLAGTTCNFIALHYLQLAQTGAIMMSIPLFVCALSVPLLSERVGLRRWLAVLAGFFGVLVVIRPGLEGFNWAALFSVCAALAIALYQLVTRMVTASDASATTLFYTALVGTVVMAPAVPFYWTPPGGTALFWMAAMGLFGAGGHYLLIRAHHMAPAAVLAPYSYTQIIWMIFIGFLIFHNVPDLWTVVGALIVIASGLYIFHREHRLARRSRREPA